MRLLASAVMLFALAGPVQGANAVYEPGEYLQPLGLGTEPLATTTANAYLGIIGLPEGVVEELELTEKGAIVGLVQIDSPASRAELQPGDRIIEIGGTPITSFAELVGELAGVSPGDEVVLTVVRGELHLSTTVELGTRPDAATVRYGHEAGLRNLEVASESPGPRTLEFIADQHWALFDLAKADAVLTKSIELFPDDVRSPERLLPLLRRRGDFHRHADTARKVINRHGDSVRLRSEYAVSLLALGEPSQAERQVRVGLERILERPADLDPETARRVATEFAVFWSLARMRRGAWLESELLDRVLDAGVLDPVTEGQLGLWRSAAGEEPVFILARESARSRIELTRKSIFRPHTVPTVVNGTVLSSCAIDTGAGATVLSPAAAEEAGILTAEEGVPSLLGFTEGSVRAGFVETLQLGDVTIRNVPVYVGHELPFSVMGIDAALGVDLMHHVQFTLRYAAEEVLVEPINTARTESDGTRESWELSLWTLPFMTLCDARYQDTPVRLLLDTGNYDTTLVSTAWARANLPPRKESLLSSLANLGLEEYTLTGLVLGDVELSPWSCSLAPKGAAVFDGLVDVVMGQDLLGSYDVTIDLRNRVLRLTEPCPM